MSYPEYAHLPPGRRSRLATRAALAAGCAGITASHTLWQRDYRDVLHPAAPLRDQLAA